MPIHNPEDTFDVQYELTQAHKRHAKTLLLKEFTVPDKTSSMPVPSLPNPQNPMSLLSTVLFAA